MADLSALILLAYPARYRLNGAESPTWDTTVQTVVASGVARADIVAKRDALAQVEDRCVVSKTQRTLLDDALALMPA
jgi:hypothetical protein